MKKKDLLTNFTAILAFGSASFSLTIAILDELEKEKNLPYNMEEYYHIPKNVYEKENILIDKIIERFFSLSDEKVKEESKYAFKEYRFNLEAEEFFQQRNFLFLEMDYFYQDQSRSVQKYFIEQPKYSFSVMNNEMKEMSLFFKFSEGYMPINIVGIPLSDHILLDIDEMLKYSEKYTLPEYKKFNDKALSLSWEMAFELNMIVYE